MRDREENKDITKEGRELGRGGSVRVSLILYLPL